MIDASLMAQRVLNIVGQMHELHRPRTVPTENALRHVIEEVFWSSVDRYEGNPLRARIFFAPKLALGSANIVQLALPCPVSRHTIRQLSPAHAPDGALLAVEGTNDQLHIAAILGSSPFSRGGSPLWLCVECRAPGVLRVSIGSRSVLEFVRGTLKVVGGMSLDRTAAEFLINRVLGTTEPSSRAWHVSSMLLDIGNAIERKGVGGAVWILPSGVSMDGNLEALGYRVEMSAKWWEPYMEMWELRTSAIAIANSSADLRERFWQAAQEWDHLRQDAVTNTLASLATVDGAIVISGLPQVLAFGVICNKFHRPASEVLRLTDPKQPLIGEAVNGSEFGGSRHRSAIDFCSSYSPAGAVVASHDGGLTVFASLEQGRVLGSRVSVIESDSEVHED